MLGFISFEKCCNYSMVKIGCVRFTIWKWASCMTRVEYHKGDGSRDTRWIDISISMLRRSLTITLNAWED